MADGIRIQPQRARLAAEGIHDVSNRLFIIRDVSRPTIATVLCRTCGVVHDVKTYHLQLEADGTVMVSTTIWDRLQRLYDHGGFELVNVVPDPPDVHLSLEPLVRPLSFADTNGKGV